MFPYINTALWRADASIENTPKSQNNGVSVPQKNGTTIAQTAVIR